MSYVNIDLDIRERMDNLSELLSLTAVPSWQYGLSNLNQVIPAGLLPPLILH